MKTTKKELEAALKLSIEAHLDMHNKWPTCSIICPNKPCKTGCTKLIAAHFIKLAKGRKK